MDKATPAIIYLDNAASTRPTPTVVAKMQEVALQYFANPSSLHRMGMQAHDLLEKARRQITQFSGVTPEWLTFTSCATEANQTVLKGGVKNSNKNRNHILMTIFEHNSVLNTIQYLNDRGYEVEFLIPDQNGVIDPLQLKNKMRETTELVSIIGVHNELGTIQNIGNLKAIVKQANPKTIFHVDGVQWFGKFPLPPIDIMPDFFTFSGHKLHAPRGVGGLFHKPNIDLKPLLHGGGQESKYRSGTENLPAIVGLWQALEENHYVSPLPCRHLQTKIYQYCLAHPQILWLGLPPGENRSPYICLLALRNKKSEIIIHQLEEKGVFVSSGSACSERSRHNQNNWSFLNLSKDYQEGIIRVSLSFQNTEEEVDYFLKELEKLL